MEDLNDEDFDKVLHEFKDKFKATLIHFGREGTPVDKAIKEFSSDWNTPFPVVELGFESPIQLLEYIDDTVHLQNKNGRLYAIIVPDETTKHVTDLVNASKKKQRPKANKANKSYSAGAGRGFGGSGNQSRNNGARSAAGFYNSGGYNNSNRVSQSQYNFDQCFSNSNQRQSSTYRGNSGYGNEVVGNRFQKEGNVNRLQPQRARNNEYNNGYNNPRPQSRNYGYNRSENYYDEYKQQNNGTGDRSYRPSQSRTTNNDFEYGQQETKNWNYRANSKQQNYENRREWGGERQPTQHWNGYNQGHSGYQENYGSRYKQSGYVENGGGRQEQSVYAENYGNLREQSHSEYEKSYATDQKQSGYDKNCVISSDWDQPQPSSSTSTSANSYPRWSEGQNGPSVVNHQDISCEDLNVPPPGFEAPATPPGFGFHESAKRSPTFDQPQPHAPEEPPGFERNTSSVPQLPNEVRPVPSKVSPPAIVPDPDPETAYAYFRANVIATPMKTQDDGTLILTRDSFVELIKQHGSLTIAELKKVFELTYGIPLDVKLLNKILGTKSRSVLVAIKAGLQDVIVVDGAVVTVLGESKRAKTSDDLYTDQLPTSTMVDSFVTVSSQEEDVYKTSSLGLAGSASTDSQKGKPLILFKSCSPNPPSSVLASNGVNRTEEMEEVRTGGGTPSIPFKLCSSPVDTEELANVFGNLAISNGTELSTADLCDSVASESDCDEEDRNIDENDELRKFLDRVYDKIYNIEDRCIDFDSLRLFCHDIPLLRTFVCSNILRSIEASKDRFKVTYIGEYIVITALPNSCS